MGQCDIILTPSVQTFVFFKNLGILNNNKNGSRNTV